MQVAKVSFGKSKVPFSVQIFDLSIPKIGLAHFHKISPFHALVECMALQCVSADGVSTARSTRAILVMCFCRWPRLVLKKTKVHITLGLLNFLFWRAASAVFAHAATSGVIHRHMRLRHHATIVASFLQP